MQFHTDALVMGILHIGLCLQAGGQTVNHNVEEIRW